MMVRWDKGGEAELVMITMDKVAVLSTVPSPPGSRIEGTLSLEGEARLRMKVHSCRLDAEGRFRIEGRPLDLTKAVLTRVAGEPPANR